MFSAERLTQLLLQWTLSGAFVLPFLTELFTLRDAESQSIQEMEFQAQVVTLDSSFT